MITEDYVSFEIAKLLKEKGFDALCPMIYTTNGKLLYTDIRHPNVYAVTNQYLEHYTDIIAPSQTMAVKWLRKEHFLFIDMDPLTGYKWSWSIWLMNDPTQKMGESLQIISNYNEACEAAIKYCLENLI